jgi:plastocyanin
VRRRSLLVLLAAAGAAAGMLLPASGDAQPAKLFASVGPAFEISLRDASGNRVTQLEPGTYEVVVSDKSNFHNFHLVGPGVNQRTTVEEVAETTWNVTFAVGNYEFQCDPHSSEMRGTFRVGNPTTTTTTTTTTPSPTPKRKLSASVGPGFTIALRTTAGKKVVTTKAGLYDITVRDRSDFHNFHFTGPGVNRKTTVPFVGTTTWKNVRLQAGKVYRFVCDPHKTQMKGSFRAVR